MDLARVGSQLEKLGAPKYRLDQVRQAVFTDAVENYDEIAVLPAALRKGLTESAPILSATPSMVQVSRDARAHKALMTLHDGKVVETVLLRPSQTRWTTCISSQVGCAIACTFCATGLMGLARNLTAEEIVDQVLFWRQYMRKQGLEGRIDNVVYMGMGEPFANYDEVADSLRRLTDQKQFGIGARHISVSTAGLAQQMERFAVDFPQINLALSLHAADDTLRTKLVPLNKAYPLARLAEALRKYLSLTPRKVFLEYVMLQGENDSPQDAKNLLAWAKSIGRLELLHANLIVFNKTDTPHEATAEDDARQFQDYLLAGGLHATVRQNLGRDIQGACGQLIVEEQKKK